MDLYRLVYVQLLILVSRVWIWRPCQDPVSVAAGLCLSTWSSSNVPLWKEFYISVHTETVDVDNWNSKTQRAIWMCRIIRRNFWPSGAASTCTDRSPSGWLKKNKNKQTNKKKPQTVEVGCIDNHTLPGLTPCQTAQTERGIMSDRKTSGWSWSWTCLTYCDSLTLDFNPDWTPNHKSVSGKHKACTGGLSWTGLTRREPA